MANKGPSTPARTISEVDAHLLLARAAELDARLGARVSTDTLWRSAREAGISVEALAQATAELDSGALAAPSRSRAIAVSAVLLTRVGIAGTIVIALIVNPKYPFA